MNDHLKAVADPPDRPGGPSESPPSEPAPRAVRRMRPNKPLPTDRMKKATQVQALKAIAVASASREQGVSASDIAARIGVADVTAGLNNAFFAEAGWVERTGKGLYKPTDAALKFAQRFGFNETEAASLLAPSIGQTWYFREIEPELRIGRPLPMAQAVSILANAAGAGAEYRSQLENVVEWLDYVGLVVITDGHLQLGQRDIQDLQPPADDEQEREQQPAGSVGSDPARSAVTGAAKEKRLQAQAVVSLDFDLSLAADDLAKLEPEQITALFKAVGEIAAIKAKLA